MPRAISDGLLSTGVRQDLDLPQRRRLAVARDGPAGLSRARVTFICQRSAGHYTAWLAPVKVKRPPSGTPRDSARRPVLLTPRFEFLTRDAHRRGPLRGLVAPLLPGRVGLRVHLLQLHDRYVRVDLGCRQAGVTEKCLNETDVRAIFQH